jgi:hypothetical protein
MKLDESNFYHHAAALYRAWKDFKVSDTPPGGPEEISGHPATAGPHNNKEIA